MSKSAHALVFCRLFFIHNFPCQLGRCHSLFFYFYELGRYNVEIIQYITKYHVVVITENVVVKVVAVVQGFCDRAQILQFLFVAIRGSGCKPFHFSAHCLLGYFKREICFDKDPFSVL